MEGLESTVKHDTSKSNVNMKGRLKSSFYPIKRIIIAALPGEPIQHPFLIFC